MISPLRVLYVDDEPALLEIGKLFLEGSGDFNVTTALSAAEALRLLEQEQFDTIISDYMMPGLDGIQFLVEVRTRFGSVPFILFTGKGREEVVIQAINSGADFYLQKGGEPGAQFAELSHKVKSAASRKRAEVALWESEAKFHSLYVHMVEGAVLHELTYDDQGIPNDYVIIETNPAFETQLGISRDMVIGKTSREAYGVTEPPYLEIYARVALTGEQEVFETYYPPLAKHFSISAYCPYKGSFATIFEDITGRKLAEEALLKNTEELHAAYEELTASQEELRANLGQLTRQELALRESEEKYRGLFSGNRDGIVIVDVHGRFIDANPVYCTMLGYSVEELRTNTFSGITPKKWQAWENEEIWNLKLMKEGYTGIYEKEYIRKDGTVFPVEIQAFCVSDQDRTIKYVWGIARDITGRKREEDAFRESEARYRTLVENIPQKIFMKDRNSHYVSINENFARDLGILPDEIVGKSDADLFPAHIAAKYRADDTRIMETGQTEEFEERYLNEGIVSWVHTIKTVVRDKNGIVSGVCGVFWDITGSRLAQEELIRKSEALAATGEELTYQFDALAENERALAESEAQKIAILNGITSNIAFVDQDLRVLWANKVAAGSVNKSPAEMVGHTCYALWADPAGPCENCPTLRVFETRQPERRIMHTPDGRVWDERGEPVFDDVGNLIGVVEIAHDITDRKMAEDALRESESFNRNLIENLPDYIGISGPDGKILYMNPAATDALGYTMEEMIGTSMLTYVATEYRDGVIARMAARYQGGSVPPYEIEVLTRDGHRISVIVKGAPIQYPGTTAFLLVLTDITERKQAEEALRESKALIDAVVENVPLMIFLKEATDLRFVVFNRAGEELLGYDRKALLGRNNLDLFPPEQAAHFMTKDREVLDGESGMLDIPEESILTAKKGQRLLHTRKVCIRGSDGTTKFLLGISEDITERKELENEMVHQEHELRQFSTSLAAANRKLTLLSSITRHDINNQLTVLRGYLTVLEKKQPDPSLNEYFRKVSTAANRISAMIQFTKEYEDIGVHAPVWQDCRTLVDTAAKQAPLGEVMVKNDLPAGTEVFADPLVVKVFYNLLDNAVRYGGKITTIRLSVLESGDDHIVVCEDDGIGVPAEEKKKIFERGFGKNTGLGLALSREILDITGITIKETGDPGNGARFELTVPEGAWRIAGKGE